MEDDETGLIEENGQLGEGTSSVTRRRVYAPASRDHLTKITRWMKKHSKSIATVLIIVITVSIASAILVVIPYQHTGNRKPDLDSRSYTMGDTSLSTIDTTFCSKASIDLEYGYHTEAEVVLDIFEKKPNLTFRDTMLVEYPETQIHRGDSIPVMTTHIHPGSYANWNVCAVWNEGCKTKYGHILVFRSQSDFDRWYHPELSGDFDLAYWHQNIDDTVCSPCCNFQLNYTIESDYYHYIINTADTDDIICNIEINASITVHRKQYVFDPDRHYGCIANANRTSCKVSTDPGPHVVIYVSVISNARDDIARWNETVHVSLHCSPKHGVYAAIGVTVGLVVLVTGSLSIIVAFGIFRYKTKCSRGKRSLDLRHLQTSETVIPTSSRAPVLDRVGEGTSDTDTGLTGSTTAERFDLSVKPVAGPAPEDTDQRRVGERTSVTSTDLEDTRSALLASISKSAEVPSRAPENVDHRRVKEGSMTL